MGIRESLVEDIEKLQARLAAYDSIGDDVFPFGTVMLFAFPGGGKSYVVKVGEEAWKGLGNHSSQSTKPLAEWILFFEIQATGYFEVYKLTTDELPFYASPQAP